MADSIKVDGIAELRQRLKTAAVELAGKPGGKLERAMKRSVYRVVLTLADYPKQRAAVQGPAAAPVRFTTKTGKAVSFIARSREQYRRTGTLGRRWFGDIEITRSGIVGIRGKAANNTTYGPWVQSERFQTAFHRETGWITDQKALDKNSKAIDREFAIAVDKSVGN